MMRRLGSDSFKLFAAILVRDRSPQKNAGWSAARAVYVTAKFFLPKSGQVET